ncbi:MAG: chorismate mutase, partial [Rothia dentocariosa]|nr:chorismate mutase [Rothia dentocariosa]
RAMAKESSLDPEFAEKFLNFIISEVIRHHERIAIEHNDKDLPSGGGE